MGRYIQYGDSPYSIILLHGGPGAAGEMLPVAERLSKTAGVIEPFQGKNTIDELICELHEVVQEAACSPVYLVGYSWGAWLGYMYAARYPDKVKKLILVSSGPFEKEYAPRIMAARKDRMSEKDSELFDVLTSKLIARGPDSDSVLLQFGELMSRLDSWDPEKEKGNHATVDFEQHRQIWEEASRLRENGQLLKFAADIACPVTAIHGIEDPHPYDGVVEPLSRLLRRFHFILLEQCGHTPWIEKEAKEIFYTVLHRELDLEPRSK